MVKIRNMNALEMKYLISKAGVTPMTESEISMLESEHGWWVSWHLDKIREGVSSRSEWEDT